MDYILASTYAQYAYYTPWFRLGPLFLGVLFCIAYRDTITNNHKNGFFKKF